MKNLIYVVMLQCKFFLIAFLNNSYSLFPNPLRKSYLFLFGFKLGRGAFIHRGCKFFHVGNLLIGEDSCVNFGCYLDNRRGIIIGNNVGVAHNTKIYTLGHNLNSPQFETKGAPVIIEDNVFIFSNVLIMPGVTIHEGAIILAGSVVTKNVPEWTVVGGNPAKEVKKRIRDISYKQNYKYWFAL